MTQDSRIILNVRKVCLRFLKKKNFLLLSLFATGFIVSGFFWLGEKTSHKVAEFYTAQLNTYRDVPSDEQNELDLASSDLDTGKLLWNTTFMRPNSKDTKAEILAEFTRSRSERVKDDDVAVRMQRINRTCRSERIPGQVRAVFVDEKSKVVHCSAHKVASSYWIQIFRFLANDVKRHVESPQDISKFETHLVPLRTTKKINFNLLKEREQVSGYYRFMMTRDPYKRLWSVYIDKFILVDNYFWAGMARDIKRLASPSGKYSSHCHFVSFTEFLAYVAEKGSKNPGSLDEHILPVHQGCNPCTFHPDLISKVEHMTTETIELLHRMNVSTKVSSFEEHVENEIRFLSDFQYDFQFDKQTACASQVDREQRLLQTFVLNGYMPSEVAQGITPSLPMGKTKFVSTVLGAFYRSNATEKSSSIQRRRFRTQAFRAVPLNILESIQKVYALDFLLFGYDPRPDYIFSRNS